MSQDPNSPTGPVLSGPVLALRTVVDRLDAVSRWTIVATMAGMALLVSAQVFQRYVMSSSIDAADELSRLLFVWSIFLAIPHGIRRGIHVGSDVVVRICPGVVQEALQRISALAGMALMATGAAMAYVAAMDKWGELMPTLPVTAALYYLPVLIAAVHSTLHLALFALGGRGVWGEHAWKESVL